MTGSPTPAGSACAAMKHRPILRFSADHHSRRLRRLTAVRTKRKLLFAAAILAAAIGVPWFLLPLPGGLFLLVISLYLFFRASNTARELIKGSRRRWPAASRVIHTYRTHRYLPAAVRRFIVRTDPGHQDTDDPHDPMPMPDDDDRDRQDRQDPP